MLMQAVDAELPRWHLLVQSNNGNTGTRFTMTERRHRCLVSSCLFGQILYIVLVFSLLTLNNKNLAGLS